MGTEVSKFEQTEQAIETSQKVLDLKKGTIHSVCVLNNKQIACGSNREINIWEVVNSNDDEPFLIETLHNESDSPVLAILLLEDKKKLACTDGNLINIWGLNSDETIIRTLTGHKGTVNCLVQLEDKSRIASGSEDGTVIVWDVESGQILNVLRPVDKTENSGYITALAALEDDYLAIGLDNGEIKIWDYDVDEEVRTLIACGKDYNIDCLLALSGHRLVSSADETIQVWDYTDGEIIFTLADHTGGNVSSLCLLKDYITLAGAADDDRSDTENVRLWDLTTGRFISSLKIPRSFFGEYNLNHVKCMTLLNDGRLCTCQSNGSIIIWKYKL